MADGRGRPGMVQRRKAHRTRHRSAVCVVALAVLVVVTTLHGTLASPRLAKPGSTHPSFPLDAFAKPAYTLIFADDEPVGNATAKELLRLGRKAQDPTESSHDIARVQTQQQREALHDENEAQKHLWPQTPFRAYLHRSTPDRLHVCTVTDPQPAESSGKDLYLDEAGVAEYRRRVLSRALELLAPLKDMCLYYTHNWFTYSLCYGDAIKQFRALSGNLVAGKAPTPDPTKPSFVLGRWRDGIDTIRGDEGDGLQQGSGHARVTDGAREGSAANAAHAREADVEARPSLFTSPNSDVLPGSELMELVHFSSLDDTPDSKHTTDKMTPHSSLEGKGRYISQTWTDGTLCDMNDEPRTAEVQYHCTESSSRDRIAYIKEVTTCNYVVVVETARLCQEPALKQKADEVHEVRCRPILSDAALRQHAQKRISDQHAALAIDAARASARAEKQAAQGQGAKEDAKEHKEQPEAMKAGDEVHAESRGVPDQKSSQAVLQAILDSLRANMHDAAPGDAADDVEIVVGWDENGQFILEPRRDGATLDPSEIFGQAGVDAAQKQANEHFKGSEDSKQSSGTKGVHSSDDAVERLREALQKARELTNAQGGDGQEEAVGKPNAKVDEKGRPLPKMQSPNNAAPHVQKPLRNVESLGQRVERFYKMREAEGQTSDQDEEKAKGAEDAKGANARHIEL